MDKHKDFIRVDDVFKSLGDGEEQYRSGAWGQMKDLLDKEMPVSSGVSSSGLMYRYLIPLMVLLLAGTSYYFWNRSANNDQAENAQPMVVNAGSLDDNANRGTSSETIAPNDKGTAGGNQLDPKDPHSGKTVVSVGVAGTSKHPETITEKQNNQNSNKGSNHKSPSTQPITGNKNLVANYPNTSSAHDEHQRNHQYSNKSTNNGSLGKIVTINAAVQNKNEENALPMALSVKTKGAVVSEAIQKGNSSTDIASLQESLPVLQKETVIQQFKPVDGTNTIEKQSSDAAVELAQKNQLTKVASVNDKNLYQSDNGGWYKEQKDTFRQLKLVRRTNQNTFANEQKILKPIFDTLSESRIAKVSFVPLSYAEIKYYQLEPKLASVALVPNAQIATKGTLLNAASSVNSEVNLVPLQQYKVSSRQMNASAISRLLHSANSGISGLMDGSKNWYVSLLIGGNSGLGSPNAYGMQLGASFLYSIAERWTLSLGVKYQKNYYSNFRFWDSAISYALKEEKTPNGTKFFGTEYVNQTAVNVNSLSRLSVPVLVSYNLGRVSVFAGPEFSYFFALNHQKTNSLQTSYVSKMTYDNKNPFIEQVARLNPATDFQSRFAAGYTFGFSYDFSRKISVDIRMNQMVWDNTGKYKLDALRNIYHQPAVEVNLDFFLGRRDKVIYIMDKNR